MALFRNTKDAYVFLVIDTNGTNPTIVYKNIDNASFDFPADQCIIGQHLDTRKFNWQRTHIYVIAYVDPITKNTITPVFPIGSLLYYTPASDQYLTRPTSIMWRSYGYQKDGDQTTIDAIPLVNDILAHLPVPGQSLDIHPTIHHRDQEYGYAFVIVRNQIFDCPERVMIAREDFGFNSRAKVYGRFIDNIYHNDIAIRVFAVSVGILNSEHKYISSPAHKWGSILFFPPHSSTSPVCLASTINIQNFGVDKFCNVVNTTGFVSAIAGLIFTPIQTQTTRPIYVSQRPPSGLRNSVSHHV